MRRCWIKKLGAIFIALLLPSFAGAQTFDVKQLDVKKGALELGLDNTGHAPISRPDVNRSAHDQSLDYGVTDWWRLSGVIKLENPLNDDFRIARTAVENIFVLRALSKEGGIGLGWFTSLEVSTDPATTNSSLFGPIVVLQRDKFSFSANPFFEKTFGRNRVEGIALNYGWNAKYQLNEGLAVGVEGFGLIENLGDPLPVSEQEHRIGPALFMTIKLANDLTITPDVGLFFGLTEATPNVTLKFNVGIPLLQPPSTRK
jgi:hypothetical protein